MTDDLTHDHLRALLAEQTTRAERAEVDYRRVLSERAAANQLAGRCAQQRDHALAACAEMRAALERHVCQHVECSPIETHAGCHARHTLSRPDLGTGKVLVERERLTAWRDVLTELAPTCRCDEAWTSRGRHEVNALCHMADDAKVAIADLDALLGKAKQ